MNKVYIAKNVALLQINIQAGQDEYYLPKNVAWKSEIIDKIALYAPAASGQLSPVDGVTPVLTQADVDSMYLDLFDQDEHTICSGMSAAQILHTNNYPFVVGRALQLNLSRIYFTQTPQNAGCILLYIYYRGKVEYDYEAPQKNITIQFPLEAGEEISFTRLINTYIHAPSNNVRGVTFWDPDQNPAYITLRDHQNTNVLHNIATALCRPQMAADKQVQPLYLDSIDIDFDNSYIRNATGSANTQTMTIKY